jgi:hypothetical protein
MGGSALCKTHGRIKNLQECGGSAVAKHGRIKSLQVAAGLYKSTEDREGTARNAVDLPFTKSTEKNKACTRNAVDQS